MWGVLDFLRDNWEVETEPAAWDLRFAVVFAVFFPALRYVLDTFVFETLGRKFVFRKANLLKKNDPPPSSSSSATPLPASEVEVLEKTHIKFKESCWKSSYYLSAELFSLAVTLGEPWLQETKYLWVGPGEQRWPEQLMKLKLKTLYAYVGGFYTYSIFALIFWETRRKDFGVSMTHHVATVVLIVASYLCNFGRVCSIVVAIHDASDVFLELAKLCRYIDLELLATVNFLIFAATWLWLRLWYFPRHIIYSSSYEVLQVLDKEKHVHDGPILYYSFNFLLILLLVLHIYWWVLIARVLWKNIAQGPIEDVRSDDEDDD